MIYAVTGPHLLHRRDQKYYVRKIVKRTILLKPGNKLVSGVAHGADTEAIIAVWGLIPFENLILTVPGTCAHNYALVDKAESCGATIIRVQNKHSVSGTYMARNDETVRQLGVRGILIAFPPSRSEEGRGMLGAGTWATIRRARKAGNRVRFYPLDKIHRRSALWSE